MAVLRKFVTLDGEVVQEIEWKPMPTVHRCFNCDKPLYDNQHTPCPASQIAEHEFVEIVMYY